MTPGADIAVPPAVAFDHAVVHHDRRAYCSHPHMVASSGAADAGGRWFLVFNRTARRDVVLHPPNDPAYHNVVSVSDDEGKTWSEPVQVPEDDATGMECAGLTALAGGGILLNQWKFRWIDPGHTDASGLAGGVAMPDDLIQGWLGTPEFAGLHADEHLAIARVAITHARAGGTAIVRRLDRNGRATTRVVVDTAPFEGGYGMRGAVTLRDGSLLMPLSDVPGYRTIFTIRSTDGGVSWQPARGVCAAPDRAFEEPAPVVLPDGEVLLLLRENVTRELHAVRSTDDGATWTAPDPTGIEDYPADLKVLRDGRLAMVAGRRRRPFGITLYLSADGGRSWSAPVAVRDDLPDRDLGYPALVQRLNGDLVIVYYGRGPDGVTAILRTIVPAAAVATMGDRAP